MPTNWLNYDSHVLGLWITHTQVMIFFLDEVTGPDPTEDSLSLFRYLLLPQDNKIECNKGTGARPCLPLAMAGLELSGYTRLNVLISVRLAWALLRVQVGFSEDAQKPEETGVWDLPGDSMSSWNWPVLPSMARSPLHSPYLSSSKAGVLRAPQAGPYL